MLEAGLDVPRADTAGTVEEGLGLGDAIGYPGDRPAVVHARRRRERFVRDRDELRRLAARSLDASPVTEVLVEESIAGWMLEFEAEAACYLGDNVVVVCSIENADPMGVHTGDSITVAPWRRRSPTASTRRCATISTRSRIRAIGVETGNNIQFAVDPRTGRRVLIDEPARLALVRARVQGHRLPDREDRRVARRRVHARRDPERHHRGHARGVRAGARPRGVVKVPRFAFEKFPEADPVLTSTMKSVGEVMAIGGTFREALGKAWRSPERAGSTSAGRPRTTASQGRSRCRASGGSITWRPPFGRRSTRWRR